MQNLNVSRQNEPTTPRAPDTGRPTARHTQSSRHRNEGRGLRPFATGHRGACMHGHVQKALTAIYTLDCGFRSRRQWNTSLQISSNNVSVEWVIMQAPTATSILPSILPYIRRVYSRGSRPCTDRRVQRAPMAALYVINGLWQACISTMGGRVTVGR
jgi:hypothetical protein